MHGKVVGLDKCYNFARERIAPALINYPQCPPEKWPQKPRLLYISSVWAHGPIIKVHKGQWINFDFFKRFDLIAQTIS